MIISIIAAMSENRVIGKDNKIPWHIKEDLVRLKALTKDQIVIVGRKTYGSMVSYYQRSGNPMPGKLYIVVTRDKSYKPARESATIANSLEEAIKEAKIVILSKAKNLHVRSFGLRPQDDRGGKEVFIIGGAQIFQQAMPLADKLYLTIVEGHFEGDAFFPVYSEFTKKVFEQKGEGRGYKYRFIDLERSSFTL